MSQSAESQHRVMIVNTEKSAQEFAVEQSQTAILRLSGSEEVAVV